jgi:chromosomal replication initiation ATPase DnaA
MKQQAFEYPVAARFGRGDFLLSDSNRAAFEWIERWPNWGARALVLYGPKGSGKTHLAHLWCARAQATLIRGEEVVEAEAPDIAALAIDDADSAAEQPLLHLYNSALERGASLLLTTRAPPAALPIALRDLASRLRALPVAGIAAPDDELLGGVLVKHFADRGLHVAPAVIRYLVRRIERSFAAAATTAARLDAAALSAGGPVTVPMARALLGDYSEPPSDLTVT